MTNGPRPGLSELLPDLVADQGMPIGLPYWVLCMTAMPYRETAPEQPWVRHYATSTMTVEPGYFSFQNIGGGSERLLCGVPYGGRARILMLYFQREILRTGRREIERTDSFRHHLQSLGISPGGKTYRAFRDQEIRIVCCRLNFSFDYGKLRGSFNDSIVHGGVSVQREASDRIDYETIIFGERFFNSVLNDPLLMDTAAIRQLANEPFAFDIYCWLATHLYRLEKPVTFEWTQLHNYFGVAYAQLRHFKMRFIDALKDATQVYPHARVAVDDKGGVTLMPSPPPSQ